MSRTPVTFSLKHFFKSFCTQTGNKQKLTSRQHKEILEQMGEVCKDILIDEGDLKLFGRLGNLQIRKVKPKGNKRAIDFGVSKQVNANAYHFNDHSDGYIVRILWNRKNALLNDKHMWLFRPVRAFRRSLAARIKSGQCDYHVLINSTS